jgi:TPR repeat protein
LKGKEMISDQNQSECRMCRDIEAEKLYQLALKFERGVYSEAGNSRVIKCYHESASRGHKEASFALAQCYETGSRVQPDIIEAIKWYLEATKNGHPQARAKLLSLGGKLVRTIGRDPSSKIRTLQLEGLFEIYLEAASCNNSKLYYVIGLLYLIGICTNRNIILGIKALEKSLSLGYQKARTALEYLSERYNMSQAALALSRIYEHGLGVVPDAHLSINWLIKAASLGLTEARQLLYEFHSRTHSSNAAFHLGRIYENGYGVPIDITKASYYYLLAAKAKDGESWHHLNRINPDLARQISKPNEPLEDLPDKMYFFEFYDYDACK